MAIIYFQNETKASLLDFRMMWLTAVFLFCFCIETPSSLKRKAENISDDSPEDSDSKPEQFLCTPCTAMISKQPHIKRPIREVHHLDSAPMTCIDVINGIYVTPEHTETQHSPAFPIHVMKSANPPQIDCEVEKCRRFMQMARFSGNPGKECVHLERTKNAKPYVKPVVLTSKSLQDMLSRGLMSSEWGAKCEALDSAAKQCGVDSVFPVCYEDQGPSQQWYFFSVFTNETDHWCQFQRTRVTFDSVTRKWNCQCQGTERSQQCIHVMMGMWWIFQETSENSIISETTKNISTAKICRMTEYIYTKKRIPRPKDLKLGTQEEKPPPSFVPWENTCPYCPGPTPPQLNAPKVITNQAVIYGLSNFHKGKSQQQQNMQTVLCVCLWHTTIFNLLQSTFL